MKLTDIYSKYIIWMIINLIINLFLQSYLELFAVRNGISFYDIMQNNNAGNYSVTQKNVISQTDIIIVYVLNLKNNLN